MTHLTRMPTVRRCSCPNWTPGDVFYIQNWPTLSKDANNPDAELWDPKNPSDCAKFLTLEGMHQRGVSVASQRFGSTVS